MEEGKKKDLEKERMLAQFEQRFSPRALPDEVKKLAEEIKAAEKPRSGLPAFVAKNFDEIAQLRRMDMNWGQVIKVVNKAHGLKLKEKSTRLQSLFNEERLRRACELDEKIHAKAPAQGRHPAARPAAPAQGQPVPGQPAGPVPAQPHTSGQPQG